MPKFVFKAKNLIGENVDGTREAASEQELLAALRSEGLVVFFVKGHSADKAPDKDKKPGMPRTLSAKQPLFGGSISDQDVAVFCRQAAALINAGISIVDAMDDLSTIVANPRFGRIIKTVAADIRSGVTLSDAMKRHQKIFGQLFVAMVAVGEKTGKLGTVLEEMAAYLEKAVALKRKVKSAAAYPGFIAGFFAFAVTGIVFFLIPRFKAMFSSFGAELPYPTKIAFAVSDWCVAHFPLLSLAGIGTIVAMIMVYRTPSGRFLIDTWQLRMPIFGDIISKVLFARFFQTLSTMLRSGVDLLVSLEIAGRVMGNGYMEKVVDTVRTRVVEGATLATAFEQHAVFPRIAVRMTAVGEKSGRLDDMFVKLSGYYNDEVDSVVAGLSSLIEPLLIVVMGGLVGGLVIVMYLPIFRLAGAMMSGIH